jgi:hypothetical protein
VIINGRNGAQTFYGENEKVMRKIVAESSGVYFFQDIWCQIPPYEFQWNTLLRNFKLERVKGLAFRHYNFDLYRISK